MIKKCKDCGKPVEVLRDGRCDACVKAVYCPPQEECSSFAVILKGVVREISEVEETQKVRSLPWAWRLNEWRLRLERLVAFAERKDMLLVEMFCPDCGSRLKPREDAFECPFCHAYCGGLHGKAPRIFPIHSSSHVPDMDQARVELLGEVRVAALEKQNEREEPRASTSAECGGCRDTSDLLDKMFVPKGTLYDRMTWLWKEHHRVVLALLELERTKSVQPDQAEKPSEAEAAATQKRNPNCELCYERRQWNVMYIELSKVHRERDEAHAEVERLLKGVLSLVEDLNESLRRLTGGK